MHFILLFLVGNMFENNFDLDQMEISANLYGIEIKYTIHKQFGYLKNIVCLII